jgi:ferrous iron transport protein A
LVFIDRVKSVPSSNEAVLLDLCEARIGAKLRVRGLKSKPAVCQRLREMGFCELAEIHKVADNGALICQVCGARVALSRKLGKEIIVEHVPAVAGGLRPQG